MEVRHCAVLDHAQHGVLPQDLMLVLHDALDIANEVLLITLLLLQIHVELWLVARAIIVVVHVHVKVVISVQLEVCQALHSSAQVIQHIHHLSIALSRLGHSYLGGWSERKSWRRSQLFRLRLWRSLILNHGDSKSSGFSWLTLISHFPLLNCTHGLESRNQVVLVLAVEVSVPGIHELGVIVVTHLPQHISLILSDGFVLDHSDEGIIQVCEVVGSKLISQEPSDVLF